MIGRIEIDENHLRAMLEDFKQNDLGIDAVVAKLRDLPYEDLDFAKIDHHRAIRKGFPEVVFG